MNLQYAYRLAQSEYKKEIFSMLHLRYNILTYHLQAQHMLRLVLV